MYANAEACNAAVFCQNIDHLVLSIIIKWYNIESHTTHKSTGKIGTELLMILLTSEYLQKVEKYLISKQVSQDLILKAFICINYISH